jgi:two-component system sensor histidine kinase UhpB
MEEHERRQFLSRKLIQLLELDRQRVAMELHDHIGQILGTLKMDLELLALQVAPRHPNLIELARSAYQKAVQAVKGVKDISYGLRPSILDNLGLVSSIAALINDFQSVAGIEIRFFHKNLPKRFDQEKETAIYRIVQEALTNIVKHANASEVYINLSRREHALHLTVEDNGTGFIPEDFPREASKGKLGLLIMQERVAQLNGQLSIESRVGGGVYLWAEIPL